jgi:hypothetical protein
MQPPTALACDELLAAVRPAAQRNKESAPFLDAGSQLTEMGHIAVTGFASVSGS